ncbi:nitrous oxide reductase accessory protein NosL [Sulfurimonas gotlandica]|uniref:nitrous oxide reductase accessory protein NosL n=1 Tax=Sulfurimonas gotlandica TaxID=1176482 RepID=UPI001F520A2D|nr:nitrous oxide reductase accessory protein NosL [Sulfurimonas gotlandica]
MALIVKYLKVLLLLVIGVVFLACEKKAETGVAEVHWDRDMCSRCVMVVSDRKNTVQVRNPDTSKTYMFDDIGCMALWFEEEKIEWKNKAIVWVTDLESGEFIDARAAFYDTNNITPMAYGFSAHKSKNSIKKDEEIISYDEVIKRVVKIGQ